MKLTTPNNRISALAAFFTITVCLNAATYYVSTSGNDSNSCTQAQSSSTPKLTISGGASCLAAGDTLLIMAGTYQENQPSSLTSGTSSNVVTIKANPGSSVVIKPPSGTGNGWYLGSQQYITFDGLTWDGNLNPGGALVK